MTPEIAAKIVASLDAELARRREKRDREEEQRWREESDDAPVVFARHYLDCLVGRVGVESPEEAAAIVMALAGDDTDREKRERVEAFAEWIVGFGEKVQLLECRAVVEPGSVHRPCPTIQVKSKGLASAASPLLGLTQQRRTRSGLVAGENRCRQERRQRME